MCNKRKKIRRDKTKKLSQFLKSHISGTREAISLKCGMWSAEVGGNVHSKIRLVPSRKHRATEVRKLRFLSSFQYTHGCYTPASWAARHTTVCLDVESDCGYTFCARCALYTQPTINLYSINIPPPFVTGFAKSGLPHTSNLSTLTTHNFRLEMAIDLKIGQY